MKRFLYILSAIVVMCTALSWLTTTKVKEETQLPRTQTVVSKGITKKPDSEVKYHHGTRVDGEQIVDEFVAAEAYAEGMKYDRLFRQKRDEYLRTTTNVEVLSRLYGDIESFQKAKKELEADYQAFVQACKEASEQGDLLLKATECAGKLKATVNYLDYAKDGNWPFSSRDVQALVGQSGNNAKSHLVFKRHLRSVLSQWPTEMQQPWLLGLSNYQQLYDYAYAYIEDLAARLEIDSVLLHAALEYNSNGRRISQVNDEIFSLLPDEIIKIRREAIKHLTIHEEIKTQGMR